MSYRWEQDPQDLFTERHAQMIGSGLPAEDVAAVRAAVTLMWPDRPGGWVHEWSALAARYAAEGLHSLAASAYGYAKFPVLADDAKRAALRHQTEQYVLASAGFPVTFERRVLDIAHQGATVPVPVHLYAAPGVGAQAPVLLASGGVDTWKTDLHQVMVTMALNTGARVLAFDIPGTGENTSVPLGREGAEVIDGLIAAARALGNGTVAHLGISMGGYYSAYSGLSGKVDAAVVLGGPVEATFARDRNWKFGMADIVGNAVGFDHQPTPGELADRYASMSLRPLLDQDTNAPMLIVNGADDVHVPRPDTLVFEGRRDTEVHLLPDTGHCAVSKSGETIPLMVGWLTGQLGTTTA
ncbi:alpha/beta hydrolase [Streptomyces sp. NPDC052051]|uniref:alpha/beta hydrolase family protein n=1 Tax=Streptomyces sp. NPDC052051 TaxID=3154649 RepID=UPI00342A1CAB